jgi:hypothetical protein
MNQELKQIQQEIMKERVIDKARVIASAKRVRRSQANPSIWLVGSQTSAKKFYSVQWIEELDCYMCDCKSFAFSSDNPSTCKHVYACAMHEGVPD